MYLNRHRPNVLCKLIVFETVLRIGNPILRQSYNFSTNGCRVDTNALLSFFVIFFNLKLENVATHFLEHHIHCFISFVSSFSKFWTETR